MTIGALGVLARKVRSAGIRVRRSVVSQRFGFTPSAIYDDAFYDGPACTQGLALGRAVAGLLFERYKPRSMFDFGCGHGAILAGMAALGVDSAGCEGSIHGVTRCPKDAIVFQADLKRPVNMNRTFDLVTCIEVAEHLPARSAPTLVQSISNASAHRIVFSASPPGHPGDDHINLQPPSYWIQLFTGAGFRADESESETIRTEMRKVGAPEWFQNTIVLERAKPANLHASTAKSNEF